MGVENLKALTHGRSKMKILNAKTDGTILDTTIPVSFTIHDFEVSYNGQRVTEEECVANASTLIGKPVLVQYFNEGNKEKDHLGTHGEYITINRDTGEDMLATDTFAIGVFTDTRVEDVEIDGKPVRCLVGDAVLWGDRYYNVCSLLKEWMDKEIDIYCSCEYTFYNFELKDGVQYIKTPFSYEGHTILNSEEKDGYGVVLPAYASSRIKEFNSALDKDLQNIKNEQEERVIVEVENIFKKAFNGISFGETRDMIYEKLAKVMPAEEYNTMWISNYDIFDDHFTYEAYNSEDEKWHIFSIPFTKSENDITVKYEEKRELEYKLVEKEQEIQNAVNAAVKEKDDVINALNTSLKEKEDEITSLNEQIKEKETSVNSLTEQLTTAKESEVSLSASIKELNETITSLNEYKEKMEADEAERKLNEIQEEYKEKFVGFNALDKYESEEVQQYIKDVLDPDKSINAKLALANALLECVPEMSKSNNARQDKGTSYEPLKNMSGLGSGEKLIIKATDIIE